MIQKPLPSELIGRDNRFVTVSNGFEFFRIPQDDLSDAQADGFYRPVDRGLTIVSNGEQLFEIPIEDADAAAADGYRNLLVRELRTETDHRPKRLASIIRDTKSAVSTETLAAIPSAESLELMEGLTQAEQALEQERIERERAFTEATGWRRYALSLQFWFRDRHSALLQQLRGSGISLLIHVALLLLLASLVLVTEEPEQLTLSASTVPSRNMVEEVIIDPLPLDIAEPTEQSQPEAPAESEEVAVAMPDAAPDFLAGVSGDAVKPPVMPAAKADSSEAMPVKQPTIFGSRFTAINYVFVIDNSNSMTKGRFETAIGELMLTINQLTPKQRFYIIFYSDTAYPMMHPNPVKELVAATKQNKYLLFQWLQTVELCLKTNGKQALQAAFDLEPDVIYVLGDGAFTDGAAEAFAKTPHPRIIVHTRGMEVKEKDAIAFRKLAETNRGTYMDVGVAPQGALMAKQFPRRRNNTRGPIWGVTLPLAKK